jgi:transcriptional regulator with XRE-family HTH domain
MDHNTNPFGAMVVARWQAKNIHQAEFCRRVGMPAGWVQQIREGRKTPPLERMEHWANVLDLHGEQRQLFLDLAAVMHLPETHRARFIRLARGNHSLAVSA